ncbi:MAG: ParB N-terminal domain-containing protein [Gemmatales bacterium]|nr:ParB N-terminal domain-containing protein [Gemmatales bacterium]MDW7995348.1 ParB N-terminal domain-containing protein [Gemmatales bacterium]
MAASIREFGFRQPIIVNPDGVIIVGHTRYKAAIKLEWGEELLHLGEN